MKAKNGVDWSEWEFEVYGDCPKYQGIRIREKRKSVKTQKIEEPIQKAPVKKKGCC